MPDRHAEKPLSLRLGALRPWVEAEARRTGKPVRRVILDAIAAARDVSVTGAAVREEPQQKGLAP